MTNVVTETFPDLCSECCQPFENILGGGTWCLRCLVTMDLYVEADVESLQAQNDELESQNEQLGREMSLLKEGVKDALGTLTSRDKKSLLRFAQQIENLYAEISEEED